MRKIKTVIELSENEIKKLEELTGTDICEDEDIEDAIRIKDGDLWDFDSDEEVIPVNARVVIE